VRINLGRIVVAVIAAELLGVLALVAVVALFGPADAAEAQTYAERMGMWIGPSSGFVLCAIGGWWVAKSVVTDRVMHGLVVGLLAAALDIALLLAAGASVTLVPAMSNVGRVVAGTLGAWLANYQQESSDGNA
jgi:apolipoprotein N-acyltransferase